MRSAADADRGTSASPERIGQCGLTLFRLRRQQQLNDMRIHLGLVERHELAWDAPCSSEILDQLEQEGVKALDQRLCAAEDDRSWRRNLRSVSSARSAYRCQIPLRLASPRAGQISVDAGLN